jgi:hypothetical protein
MKSAALLTNLQGWAKQDVQNLLTHSSAAMTDVYLEGHDVSWPSSTQDLAIR